MTSKKGYSPVPLEEPQETRTGLSPRQSYDDEENYTAGDPLLPQQERTDNDAHDTLWNKIKRSLRRWSNYSPYWTPRTHMPLNDVRNSHNYFLNFPAAYPPLNASVSPACRQEWEYMTFLPCHEKIWHRGWDAGKHESLFEPDISLYAGAICESTLNGGPLCVQRLRDSYQLLRSKCSDEDRFDQSGYVGPFSADPGLEDGPVAVMEKILGRVEHLCRRSPVVTDYGQYCAVDMYKRWFVNDGMEVGNLNGLDDFEAMTSQRREEPFLITVGRDECDTVRPNSWYFWHGSSRREWRRLGPGVNETSCSWCTMDWFERKLKSWEEGKVFERDDGKALTLPEYLRTIERAGKRCDADAWDRVWARALKKYEEEGKLPKDWDENLGNTPL